MATHSTLSKVEQADKITSTRTIYATGAGLIPFPLLDVATLLGIQIVMIRDISKVFGLESQYKKHRIKHFVTTLVGDLGTVGVISGVKAIPVVGSIVGMFGGPVVGAASTYALGKVFTLHFASGGTLLDFDPTNDEVIYSYHKHYKDGKKIAQDVKNDASDEADGTPPSLSDVKKIQADLQKKLAELDAVIAGYEGVEEAAE